MTNEEIFDKLVSMEHELVQIDLKMDELRARRDGAPEPVPVQRGHRKRPLRADLGDVPWLLGLTGLSAGQVRRLARQRQIPGAFQSGKKGRWRFHKDETEPWAHRINP